MSDLIQDSKDLALPQSGAPSPQTGNTLTIPRAAISSEDPLAHARRSFMRDFLARHSLMTGGEMKLSAGGTSSFYFDCKKATLNGAFLCAFADWILDEVAPALAPPADCVGGPTLGADFIAAAVAMRAHQRGLPLEHGCIVRKAAKAHGTQKTIENAPAAGARVLVTEDVITSGGSVASACDAFLAAGCRIAAIVVIIDREAGGKQMLEDKYQAPVHALFNRADFSEADSRPAENSYHVHQPRRRVNFA